MLLLVIVDQLNIPCVRAFPAKAYAELVIDADAVLPFAVAPEYFQAIPWRILQVLELCCKINGLYLPDNHSDDVSEFTATSSEIDLLGFFVRK